MLLYTLIHVLWIEIRWIDLNFLSNFCNELEQKGTISIQLFVYKWQMQNELCTILFIIDTVTFSNSIRQHLMLHKLIFLRKFANIF